ncbi:hypothetical protein AMECASPLE_004398, partial [Ameca splendens]
WRTFTKRLPKLCRGDLEPYINLSVTLDPGLKFNKQILLGLKDEEKTQFMP